MKYMLMIHTNQRAWSELSDWSPEDITRMVAFMEDLSKELAATGETVEMNGLTGPDQATTVRARPDDEPLVTDGPYPESKEFLAGYWVVDIASRQRAIEIATRISATPCPGGVPINQPVLVQPVGEAPQP